MQTSLTGVSILKCLGVPYHAIALSCHCCIHCLLWCTATKRKEEKIFKITPHLPVPEEREMIKIIVWYCLNRGNLASPNVSSQLTPLVAFVTNVLPTPQSPQQMQFHWNWHHHHCHQLWRIEIYWCIMVICLNTALICFVVNCRCRSWAGWASQIKTNKECETRWNFRFHKFNAVFISIFLFSQNFHSVYFLLCF